MPISAPRKVQSRKLSEPERSHSAQVRRCWSRSLHGAQRARVGVSAHTITGWGPRPAARCVHGPAVKPGVV